MANPKDILVVTTSSIEGHQIKQYLKPVSAHVVAGTNWFNDLFASFTDIFGGRSQAYQNQLASVYSEAIERVKYAAYELGANCIVGLSIDMDEISGKGKSMFMLTAVGTAVIIDCDAASPKNTIVSADAITTVSSERIKMLKAKMEMLEKAETNDLKLDDTVWSFITTHQISELFPYLLKALKAAIDKEQSYPGSSENFIKLFTGYIDSLPEDLKLELLFGAMESQDHSIALKLTEIIGALSLFDYTFVMKLLRYNDFKVQKIGLRAALTDKPYYNRTDIDQLQSVLEHIQLNFQEKGVRSMKKQLLSSKEKEVWTCTCGKTNDLSLRCSECTQDIYGFTPAELSAEETIKLLSTKIELIRGVFI
jgi:uncharacterized protein YbjQ (UPF0145 family)